MPALSWALFSNSSEIIKPDWLNQQITKKTTGWANTGEQKLDIIIRSDLAAIEQQLLTTGWQKHQPQTWVNVYQAMLVDIDSTELPLFSYVHRGEIEQLLMSRTLDEELVVLRVWDNKNSSDTDWRASLTRHRKDTDLYLFNHWGFEANQLDKSILIDGFKGGYFVLDTLPDGTLRIIKKQK
jgi:hypothetical protein